MKWSRRQLLPGVIYSDDEEQWKKNSKFRRENFSRPIESALRLQKKSIWKDHDFEYLSNKHVKQAILHFSLRKLLLHWTVRQY